MNNTNPFKKPEEKQVDNYEQTYESIFDSSSSSINPDIFEQELITQNELGSKAKNGIIERLKGLGIIGIFVLTQTLASLFAVILISYNSSEFSSQDEYIAVIYKSVFNGMAIAEILVIIILCFFYRKILKQKFKQFFSSFWTTMIKIILYITLLNVVTIVFSIIDTVLFSEYVTEVGANQAAIENALQTPGLGMIISICITAPILEEYVFRYGIIKKLLYKVPKYLAAVIAALIFSFIHIGFSQMSDVGLFVHLMLGYIGSSLVFAFIYVYEDNILYPISIHMFNNIQAVLLITALLQ